MFLKRFYSDPIAQASFLIGCAKTGEAIVVDPTLDLDPYLQAAEDEGLRITHVTETHIHADYVSGSRELARRTGARLFLSDEGDADWKYEFAATEGAVLLKDGDEIRVGNVRIRAMHAPGHTPEHLVFLVIDGAITDEPVGVLTGDLVFVGDVGRPDLLETAAGISNTMESGARTLYQTLLRFRKLSPSLILWPGHGAGSACGKSLGGLPETTLGYELATNWAFLMPDEDSFVKEVLSNQPEPPAYFATMKRVNKQGVIPGTSAPPRLSGSSLFERMSDATVVDLREREDFEAAAIEGVVSNPLGANFLKWSGSLFGPKTPLILLARDSGEAYSAVKALRLIGLEEIAGWIPVASALDAARGRDKVAPLAKCEPERCVAERISLLDVRTAGERQEESVDSLHVPLARLGLRHGELPKDRPLGVFCQTGPRSSIATSFLRSLGYDALQVDGGLEPLVQAVEKSPVN